MAFVVGPSDKKDLHDTGSGLCPFYRSSTARERVWTCDRTAVIASVESGLLSETPSGEQGALLETPSGRNIVTVER